jgi:hypothetical protein
MRNNTSIDDMIANSPLFGDGDSPAELLADAEAEIVALRQRVAELELENAALRKQVIRLQLKNEELEMEWRVQGELETALAWARLVYPAVLFAERIRPLGFASLLEQAPLSVASPASDGEGGEG